MHEDILQAVYDVIQERKTSAPDSSYTASLMAKGIDKILKKLGEEATELVIAARAGNGTRSSTRLPTCSFTP